MATLRSLRKKKGIWTFLGRYVYSGDYTYKLPNIRKAIEQTNKQTNKPVPEQTKQIFDAQVSNYKNSIWRKIFKADPKIRHLA